MNDPAAGEIDFSARYETELERAAAKLQAVLPIGQIKAIGLLEVAAAVNMLAEENSTLRQLLREALPHLHHTGATHSHQCACSVKRRIEAVIQSERKDAK